MTWVLGVDGGNSKTLAAVADERGVIAGIGRASGSNHQGADRDTAMEHIRRATRGALTQARIVPADIGAAAFCLAGADLPEDFDLLRPALEALSLARTFDLYNDSVGILRSGSDRPDAVAIGWGAGTNGVGRNAAGEMV